MQKGLIMSFNTNFILVTMKKDDDVRYVSQEQVSDYLRKGWVQCELADLGGKDD